MNRIPKSCFILMLGLVIFAIGTASDGSRIHPLSRHDAETFRGGILCYDDDGTCDTTDWCDGSTCPSPTYCSITEHVDKIFTDKDCEVLPGYENWECGVHNFGECARRYQCVIDDDDCVKGYYVGGIEGAYSCHAHPK